jgi:FkbM family methyltransferase
LIPTRRTRGIRSESRFAASVCLSIGIGQALIDTARLARLVREPVRFTIRQARRSRAVGRYRLRTSGVTVFLRHNTPDMNTLDEIFRYGHYDMPDPVLQALDKVTSPLEIVDLGANVGLFGAFAIGLFPDAGITAFEPDSANADLHERSIRANVGARWRLIRACAATENGSVPFSDSGYTLGRMGEGERVVDAVDVFPFLTTAHLVKIDVEGAEWQLLADPRFRGLHARAVGLEYHPYLCPADDPQALAHVLLREAGYETADHEAPELLQLPGHGMVWAWKSH